MIVCARTKDEDICVIGALKCKSRLIHFFLMKMCNGGWDISGDSIEIKGDLVNTTLGNAFSSSFYNIINIIKAARGVGVKRIF